MPCSIAGASASLATSIAPGGTGRQGSPLPSPQHRLLPVQGQVLLCPRQPRCSALWTRDFFSGVLEVGQSSGLPLILAVVLSTFNDTRSSFTLGAAPGGQTPSYGAWSHRRHHPCKRGGRYGGTHQTCQWFHHSHTWPPWLLAQPKPLLSPARSRAPVLPWGRVHPWVLAPMLGGRDQLSFYEP